MQRRSSVTAGAICQNEKVQNCTNASKCAVIKICTIVKILHHQAQALSSGETVLSSAEIIETLCLVGSKGGGTPRFNHFVPPRVNHRPLLVKLLLETANHHCRCTCTVPSENTKLTEIGGKSVQRDRQL